VRDIRAVDAMDTSRPPYSVKQLLGA